MNSRDLVSEPFAFSGPRGDTTAGQKPLQLSVRRLRIRHCAVRANVRSPALLQHQQQRPGKTTV